MRSVLSELLILLTLSATPADAVAAALADLQQVPAERRQQTRWVTLYNIAPASRPTVAAAVSYALNSVSRARNIARPTPVGSGDLLRIDLADYADVKTQAGYQEVFQAWEKLADADPYFHLQTQVIDPTNGKLRTVTVRGGWTGLSNAESLSAATASAGPVLRADWFVCATLAPPFYYAWLGVPAKEADFLGAVGADLPTINKLAADSAANLFHSDVTGKPRRVIYRPIPHGGLWITKDSLKDSADANPIRVPVDFQDVKLKFDATEVFYTLANGMWGTAIFDGKGNRLNAVDPKVATDTTAPSGHQELVPFISCIRCHERQGRAGLQPFVDDQTQLPLPRSAYTQVERRIAELYNTPRLSKEMGRDRQDYADAVMLAVGLDTKQAAECVAAVFDFHAYGQVSLSTAAGEVGLDAKEFGRRIDGNPDPALLALKAGRRVTRKTWESSFQEAALLGAGK
ncbi:MAG TPA: hypothetical protein VHC22_32605 [Pirellulales bacterium]|nr:hypothetical protein [Pirellulales bacterium]